MHKLVGFEIAWGGEGFGTEAAFVWLVLAVNVLMVSQMVLSPESLAADITGEGPLISVGPLMDHDIVRLGELSVTKLADESLLWSRGSALTVVKSLVTVTWTRATLTMAKMEARVKLMMTKPLLEEEGLTHLGQAGRQTREGRNVEGALSGD